MADVSNVRNDDLLKKDGVYELFEKSSLSQRRTRREYCIAQLRSDPDLNLEEFHAIYAEPNHRGKSSAERVCELFAKRYQDVQTPDMVFRVYTNYAPTKRSVKTWKSFQKRYKMKIDMRVVCPDSQGENELKEMLQENGNIRLRAFKKSDWSKLAKMVQKAPIPGTLPDVAAPSNERLAADAAAKKVFARLRPARVKSNIKK